MNQPQIIAPHDWTAEKDIEYARDFLNVCDFTAPDPDRDFGRRLLREIEESFRDLDTQLTRGIPLLTKALRIPSETSLHERSGANSILPG